MPTYRLMSGESIEYPTQPPVVADFLARAHAAAADPAVDVHGMIELIYGPENPILDQTLVPGRPMVTRAVFANPVYHILADLVGVKRVQLGLLDSEATDAAYSVSVAEAAEQLGITPAAVRAAITARKLAGRLRNGQWYTRPEAVAAYQVSNRGRKKTTAGPNLVAVCVGSEPGRSLGIKVEGGQLVRRNKVGGRVEGHLSAGWVRAVVRTTAEGGKVRVFVIDPADDEAEITHGGLYVRGPFRITSKVNNPKAANRVWETSGLGA